MNRAERRRMDREAKKGTLPLQLVPEIMAPVEMTPARIAKMKREIADDLIRRSGDTVAIEQARQDGYNRGYSDGEKFTQEHYLLLLYISCGLALDQCYNFKAKRISKVWHKIDDIFGEMLHLFDDGLPLPDVEEMFNSRLMNRTGLAFGLTASAEELRNNEGYKGGGDAG